MIFAILGGKTHVRLAFLNQVLRQQDIADRSSRGFPVLQDQQIRPSLLRGKSVVQQSRRGTYTLLIFQTPSGLKFVLNTDISSTGVKEILQQLYAKVFVEYAVRNPLWTPGTPITSDLFKIKLDEFIKQCPLYGLKNI